MLPNAHPFEEIRYERKTDLPGVFRNGVGSEEMCAGDVTYIIVHKETGLAFKNCTREPTGLWVDPTQEIAGPMWVQDKEQTAVPYDWFEKFA